MEDAVAIKSSYASQLYENFSNDLANHFSMEEIVLFPMLEQANSETSGATKAIEMEQEQMRSLLSKMRKAVEGMDKESFFSLSETLMILMQQHNMKEEQLLYTLAQSTLERMQTISLDRCVGLFISQPNHHPFLDVIREPFELYPIL